MSTLYKAKVKKIIDSQTVQLLVQDVHSDASEMSVPESPAFVLLMLFEGAIDSGSQLEKALNINDLIEDKWMENNALGFIENVKTTSHMLTPEFDENDEDVDLDELYEEIEDKNRALGATVEIKVTNPAWIAHLKINSEWDTTSYYEDDLTYKICDKITL